MFYRRPRSCISDEGCDSYYTSTTIDERIDVTNSRLFVDCMFDMFQCFIGQILLIGIMDVKILPACTQASFFIISSREVCSNGAESASPSCPSTSGLVLSPLTVEPCT